MKTKKTRTLNRPKIVCVARKRLEVIGQKLKNKSLYRRFFKMERIGELSNNSLALGLTHRLDLMLRSISTGLKGQGETLIIL